MQSVTEKIKELLISNRRDLLQADASTYETPNGICFDGIVDEQVFNEQPKKVIFLLKEPNGNDSKGKAHECYADWDYRSWLQHQQANAEPGGGGDSHAFYKTFYNVCMWLDVFDDILAGESKVLLKVHLAVTAAGSADRKTPPLADLCQCRTSKIGGRLRCCKSHFVLS